MADYRNIVSFIKSKEGGKSSATKIQRVEIHRLVEIRFKWLSISHQ
jgi:hypothetical protein